MVNAHLGLRSYIVSSKNLKSYINATSGHLPQKRAIFGLLLQSFCSWGRLSSSYVVSATPFVITRRVWPMGLRDIWYRLEFTATNTPTARSGWNDFEKGNRL